jgi:tRNA threonylcarbamoyladenosine biosynthesis protein TsaB
MKTLFIETATPLCAIALGLGDEIHVRELDTDRRHVEALTPGIAALLEEFGLSARDIERVVVDRGPGLFTGLRVGVATAIALADGVGAELAGVTSLELLAHGLWSEGVRGDVECLIDGRRGEVFSQAFRLDEIVTSRSQPTVRSPQDVVVEYGTSGAPTTFVGDGAERYRDLFSLMPWITIAPITKTWLAAGATVGRLATPGDVMPLYLREADAVANFTTRQA